MIKQLIEKYDELLIMDGFDDCIVGVGESCGSEHRVVYDVTKIVEKLMNEGMTEEDTYEWFSFNQLGAYLGEQTPIFLFT